MDRASEKDRLEKELEQIRMFLEHPLMRRIQDDNREQCNIAIQAILNTKISSIEAFFEREQCIGHLRGLGRGLAVIQEAADEIKNELKAL